MPIVYLTLIRWKLIRQTHFWKGSKIYDPHRPEIFNTKILFEMGMVLHTPVKPSRIHKAGTGGPPSSSNTWATVRDPLLTATVLWITKYLPPNFNDHLHIIMKIFQTAVYTHTTYLYNHYYLSTNKRMPDVSYFGK